MGSFSKTGRHGQGLRAERSKSEFIERGWTAVPQLVQWMATLRCRLHCPHCLAACDDSDPSPDMHFDTVASLVSELGRIGVQEFLVTGGEPLEREDLHEIAAMLDEAGLPWSLNTAACPDRQQRRAFEEHPPQFVAVSLDGPPEIHDAFRGLDGSQAAALESIGFFSGLPDCEVVAGTTVTKRNIGALHRTFRTVRESGADAWGIHLLVPEGRARKRRDLRLGRRDIKYLFEFVARARKEFRVGLADEIGYCGPWEPLVREFPVTCGAGRLQCVVLPDGEVVPCTTLDRATSAGNINERPFTEIWREGFSELRRWRPKGKCASCEYVSACGGGCWLQRRGGTHCFKSIWGSEEMVKTAAKLMLHAGITAAFFGIGGSDARARPPAPVPQPIWLHYEPRSSIKPAKDDPVFMPVDVPEYDDPAVDQAFMTESERAETTASAAERIDEFGNEVAPGAENVSPQLPLAATGVVGNIGHGGGGVGCFGYKSGSGHRRRQALGCTRAAVDAREAALAWLSRNRRADGSWRGGRTEVGDRELRESVVLTGTSTLGFLSAGHTETAGRYRRDVAAAVNWLMKAQSENGCLGPAGDGGLGLAHVVGSEALVQAFIVARNPAVGRAAQRALDYSAKAVSENGPPSDPVTMTWAMLHFRSARRSRLKVSGSAYAEIAALLRGDAKCTDSRSAKEALAAGKVLCKLVDANSRNISALVEPRKALLDSLPEWRAGAGPGVKDFEQWHLGTLAMFCLGGEDWRTWNPAMRDMLVAQQAKSGPDAGSWSPGGNGDAKLAERIRVAALGALCLGVYYNYLPAF